MGLTGKAAEWAVRKQKQHRQVSWAAMMSIDAVLNGVYSRLPHNAYQRDHQKLMH